MHGEIIREIFWLNRRRNGGSTSAGMVAQSKTEWWLNLSGLGAQRTPEYSIDIVLNVCDPDRDMVFIFNVDETDIPDGGV